ncbi:MAG: efflux RND transporter periplasmic adaptor subunit [Planctomycetaceae bacterium]
MNMPQLNPTSPAVLTHAHPTPSAMPGNPLLSPAVSPAISVSIAGGSPARGDARPRQHDAQLPGSALDFDSLYLAMSTGRSRLEATVKLTEWLAKSIPGSNVRCGLGSTRLQQFFDSRLGWLGTESNLQRELAARWKPFTDKGSESVFADSQITLRLPRPNQSKLALLCLSGDRVNDSLFKQLRQHEATIAAILWSRPRLAMPEWSTTRGRPRIAVTLAGLMVMLLLICPVPYRTACTARVEPVGARVVSAPFDAALESVFVEPGDSVTAGQPLVALDGRPLRLELQAVEAEIQQSAKQQDVAMAAGKIAEAQLAQLKCQQLGRQRDLLAQRLDQLQISSPIDGVVVVGDLRRSIGAPLEIGQVLFEIAPLDRVIIEVEIPESEIGLVKDDSLAQIRVDSAGVGTVDAALSQIYPAAQLREEQNVYVAPVEVDNQSRGYRPGMRGKATVYGPIRPWAWSYLRGAVEQATWMLGF